MKKSGIKITFKENRNLSRDLERELRPQLERELASKLVKKLLNRRRGWPARLGMAGEGTSLEQQHSDFARRVRARADAKRLTDRLARHLSRKLSDDLTSIFKKTFK